MTQLTPRTKAYLMVLAVTLVGAATCWFLLTQISKLEDDSEAIASLPFRHKSASGDLNNYSNDFQKAGWYTVEVDGMIQTVELHAYDSKGRHTGVLPLPNPPPTEFLGGEENIPNSSLTNFGRHTYLSLTTHDEYNLEVRGKEPGLINLFIHLANNEHKDVKVFYYCNLYTNAKYRFKMTLPKSSLGMPTDLKVDSDSDGIYEKTLKAQTEKCVQ